MEISLQILQFFLSEIFSRVSQRSVSPDSISKEQIILFKLETSSGISDSEVWIHDNKTLWPIAKKHPVAIP